MFVCQSLRCLPPQMINITRQIIYLTFIMAVGLTYTGCGSSTDEVMLPEVRTEFLVDLDEALRQNLFSLAQIETMCIEFWAHDLNDQPFEFKDPNDKSTDPNDHDGVTDHLPLLSRAQNGCVQVKDYIREVSIEGRSILALALPEKRISVPPANDLVFTLLLFDSGDSAAPRFIGVNRDRAPVTISPESPVKIVMTLGEPVIVTVGNVTVKENEGPAIFNLIRDRQPVGNEPVKPLAVFAQDVFRDPTNPSSAKPGTECPPLELADYLSVNTIFRQDQIEVTLCDDAIVEQSESFDLRLELDLSDPNNRLAFLAGGTHAGVVRQVVATIKDDDIPPLPDPVLFIDDVTVAEDQGPARFTVRLDPASDQKVTVYYATEDGEATSPEDYKATEDPLNFEPGQTEKEIIVDIEPDKQLEPLESFTVNLSKPTNARIVKPQGVGHIVDVVEPVLFIDDVTVVENEDTATFTVTLSHANSETVTVDYTTMNGRTTGSESEATEPSDYIKIEESFLMFAPGIVEQPVFVNIVDDTDIEPLEFFTVMLSNAKNAHIVKNKGIGAIVDNDSSAPRLWINDITVLESAKQASFTVTLEPASSQPVTVDYATEADTATAPSDYQHIATTSLTFDANMTTQQILVYIEDDKLKESPLEFFHVNLTNANNARIVKAKGVGAIVDDDDVPTLVVNGVMELEGDGLKHQLVLSLELVPAPAAAVTVTYETQPIDAEDPKRATPGEACTARVGSDEDYETTRGALTFTSVEPRQDIVLTICGDMALEPDETFRVIFSSHASEIDIPNKTMTITILNDDSAIFAKGVGLAKSKDNMGEITLNIPGEPDSLSIKAFLTWQQKKEEAASPLQKLISFDNGETPPPELDVKHVQADSRDIHCFMAEITKYIRSGLVDYTVSSAGNRDLLGAGIVVITHVLGDPNPSPDMDEATSEQLKPFKTFRIGSDHVLLGTVVVNMVCNFFYYDEDEKEMANSRVLTHTFDASDVDRPLNIFAFVGDAQSNCSGLDACSCDTVETCRGSDILFLVGDDRLPNAKDDLSKDERAMSLGSGLAGLVANEGNYWDTFGRRSGAVSNFGFSPSSDPDLRGSLILPAGSTFASFQLQSPEADDGVSGVLSMAVFEILGPPLERPEE